MKKTNLLYLFADQWRVHAMGFRGEDQAVTPNIDAFAKESVCVQHAYSTFPLCSPHRASLMTGKYPFQVGMWTNCKTGLEEKIMLKPQESCIGNVLKDHGYRTGYIGKWHLDSPEQNFVDNPESGACSWDAYTPPGERRQGFDYWLSYGADDHHLTPHYWADTPEQIRPERWSAEFETEKAMEFMENRKSDDEPFALFVSYNPPHLPYELVPDQYYDRFKDLEVQYRENVPEEMQEKGGELETITRQYFAAVYGIDQQFGRMLEFLKAHDMEENTLVVLSSDHGEMLGSHGLMSKNVWYEESIHIPLLIRQKGRLEQRNYEEIVASPDHMPTLLELLGLPVPESCTGTSHAEGLCGQEGQVPSDMFICSYPGGAEMVGEFSKLGLNHKSYGWRGIKDKNHTYVITNGYAPGEPQAEYLYDHNDDPYEKRPLLVSKLDDTEQVQHYRDRLNHYLLLTDDPFLWDRS